MTSDDAPGDGLIRLLALNDPSIPSADDCVLARMLERVADADPGRPLIELDDGTLLTYTDVLAQGRRTARGLQRLGVGRGDRVISWLPNGIEGIRVLVATSLLGATFVGLNTAYRGKILRHAVERSRAEVAVVHSSLVRRLDEIDRGRLRAIIEVGPGAGGRGGLPWSTLDVEGSETELKHDGVATEPWGEFVVLFTSGTTGPSKAVLSSYVHHYTFVTAAPPTHRPGDRVLFMSPLFHLTGTASIVQAVMLGCTLVQTAAFDTRAFWGLVRGRRIDSTFLFAPMMSFLLQQPESDADRDHPLRRVVSSPLTPDVIEFGRRFGVETYTAYAMSEIATPIASGPNPDRVGGCGVAQPNVEVRLVDEHDIEVPPGATGELVLRPLRPWSFSHGYDGDPEATAASWRNGWFHTGDAFRRGSDGQFYFVDRTKDAIRRRGENISSFEVETAVLAHTDVGQVAAVGVRSNVGEEEVLIAVVAAEGRSIDPRPLTEFLIPRLPYYMVPRYVRVLDELPLTPSARVRKHVLRDEGVTLDTWDREAAGIRVRRERFDDAGAADR